MQQRKNSLNALAYFTILGWLFSVMISSDSQKSRIHLTQSLLLNMAFLLELPLILLSDSVCSWIIGGILGLVFAIVWVTALIDAAVGRECYFYEFPDPNAGEEKSMQNNETGNIIQMQKTSARNIVFAANQIRESISVKQAEISGENYTGNRKTTGYLSAEDMDSISNAAMDVCASVLRYVMPEKAKEPLTEKVAEEKEGKSAKKPDETGKARTKAAVTKTKKTDAESAKKALSEKAVPVESLLTSETAAKKKARAVKTETPKAKTVAAVKVMENKPETNDVPDDAA